MCKRSFKLYERLPMVLGYFWESWTLGRYDSVWIFEGKDEKDAIKLWLPAGDVVRSETLVSLSREEALKLL